jgi:hypothetical protein
MGLQTDSIFIAALSADADIMEVISGRLYGTAIALPDEDADNAPVPYLIVTFDGLTNDSLTKDAMEGDTDSVQVGVTCVAQTLGGLHDLTQMVREAVRGYLESEETAVTDYQLSADAIQYDSLKPCYWQVIHYACEVEAG